MADNDILIGPGKLYRAPTGETNPDESTIAYGAAWGGNWTDMGDIIEGSPVVLTIADEETKVYTEQATSPKNAVRTRREMMIKCTLAEHTAANLAVLLDGTQTDTPAGATQKAFSAIPFGTGTEIDFYKWGIEAERKDDNGTSQPVRWMLHKGYIRLSGDINYAKQNPTGIPVEIVVLGDGSQSAGEELGELQIVLSAATGT